MTYRMFGIIGVLAMLAVAACQGEAVTEENWSPQLGSLIPVPEGPTLLKRGELGQTIARYSFSPDAETTSVTFLMQVPNTKERHPLEEDYSEWISDTYSWQKKNIRDRPRRSVMQETMKLCWLEADSTTDVMSDNGVVPDTLGRMTFVIGVPDEVIGKVARLVCDIDTEPQQTTFSVLSIAVEVSHTSTETEPFYALKTLYTRFDQNDRRVVQIE